MKIGIIGAGNIGGTLTRRLRELGHDVLVANSRGPETLRELAEETGATAVPVEEAARDRELVVVTIPEKREPLGGAPAGPPGHQGLQQHLCRPPAGEDQPRGMAGRIALPVAGDDQASPERPPGFRASADSPGTFMEPR